MERYKCKGPIDWLKHIFWIGNKGAVVVVILVCGSILFLSGWAVKWGIHNHRTKVELEEIRKQLDDCRCGDNRILEFKSKIPIVSDDIEVAE